MEERAFYHKKTGVTFLIRQAQTVHNFSHRVNMAAALVVFENERNRHQRVFQPRLKTLMIYVILRLKIGTDGRET